MSEKLPTATPAPTAAQIEEFRREQVIPGADEDWMIEHNMVLNYLVGLAASLSETATQTIWAVEGRYDYEGHDLIGIFATKEEAEAFKPESSYDGIRITEWKIGEFNK